ncbi:MAG: universal stress protein [Saprospiraceae bacterium]|nr:universal stress protein [Saprospiraceae bacterium]
MTTIQIFGIGDAKTRALRDNVAAALRLCPLIGKVEEVTEVNQITASGVSQTPALVVDGQIISEGEVPSVADLTRMLRRRSLYRAKLYRLRRILVPVDFSPSSENAYHFAWQLAEQFGSSIELVHAMSDLFDGARASSSGFLSNYLNTLREELDAFARETPQKWNLPGQPKIDPGPGQNSGMPRVRTKVIFGAPEEVLESLSTKFDLLVMGATGKGNLAARLFGTVSAWVSQNAHCPVLIVPHAAVWNGFRNILYASNFESNDPDKIQQVAAFAQQYDAQMHFVHVGPPAEKDLAVERMLFEIHYKFSEAGKPFIFEKITGDNLVDNLHEYAFRHKNDLFVFVTHHRGIWQSLTHPSATKKMLLHTDTPVLVMHQGNDMEDQGAG